MMIKMGMKRIPDLTLPFWMVEMMAAEKVEVIDNSRMENILNVPMSTVEASIWKLSMPPPPEPWARPPPIPPMICWMTTRRVVERAKRKGAAATVAKPMKMT